MSSKKKMNIVLTGSSGQVGKEVNTLLGKRFNVYSFTERNLILLTLKKLKKLFQD